MSWRDIFKRRKASTETTIIPPDQTFIVSVDENPVNLRAQQPNKSIEQRFDDDTLAAMMLAKFPGATFLGVHPKGAFQGPMLPLQPITKKIEIPLTVVAKEGCDEFIITDEQEGQGDLYR